MSCEMGHHTDIHQFTPDDANGEVPQDETLIILTVYWRHLQNFFLIICLIIVIEFVEHF